MVPSTSTDHAPNGEGTDPLQVWRRCQAEHASACIPEYLAVPLLYELESNLEQALRDGLDLDRFDELAARGADCITLLRPAGPDKRPGEQLRRTLLFRLRLQIDCGREAGVERSLRVVERLWPRSAATLLLRGRAAWLRDEVQDAAHWFQRSLERAPENLGALSGLADVDTRRQRWQRALGLRERAQEAAQCLHESDPDRRCQAVRLGLLLCQLGAYGRAGTVLREVAGHDDCGVSPSEAAALIAQLAGRLHSPAALSQFVGTMRRPLPLTASAERALESATHLARIYTAIARGPLPPGPRELLLGFCAWEAGDPEGAYVHADRADEHEADAIRAHYLLLASAEVIASAELGGIRLFATRHAHTLLHQPHGAAVERLYASLILLKTGTDRIQIAAALADADHPLARWLCAALIRRADDPFAADLAPAPPGRSRDVLGDLQALSLWRAVLRAGGSPRLWTATAASAVHARLAAALPALQPPAAETRLERPWVPATLARAERIADPAAV